MTDRFGGAATSLRIRTARVEERAALEALQWRASLVADEYREALLANPDAIALDPLEISAGRVPVAEDGPMLAGFAVWLPPKSGAAELDGLFVEPGLWRAGVGRRLVAEVAAAAAAIGASSLRVIANPAALDFYGRCGFVPGGEAQTRFGPAPVLTLPLR